MPVASGKLEDPHAARPQIAATASAMVTRGGRPANSPAFAATASSKAAGDRRPAGGGGGGVRSQTAPPDGTK